jgi:hypothetical protein
MANTDGNVRSGWASAVYVTNPSRWVMTRFWARTSSWASPSIWPLRNLCMGSLGMVCCAVESPNPQARVHPPFHKQIILFHQIIQNLALPEHTALLEQAFWKALKAWGNETCWSTVIMRGVSVCKAWITWRKKYSAASASGVAFGMKSSAGA